MPLKRMFKCCFGNKNGSLDFSKNFHTSQTHLVSGVPDMDNCDWSKENLYDNHGTIFRTVSNECILDFQFFEHISSLPRKSSNNECAKPTTLSISCSLPCTHGSDRHKNVALQRLSICKCENGNCSLCPNFQLLQESAFIGNGSLSSKDNSSEHSTASVDVFGGMQNKTRSNKLTGRLFGYVHDEKPDTGKGSFGNLQTNQETDMGICDTVNASEDNETFNNVYCKDTFVAMEKPYGNVEHVPSTSTPKNARQKQRLTTSLSVGAVRYNNGSGHHGLVHIPKPRPRSRSVSNNAGNGEKKSDWHYTQEWLERIETWNTVYDTGCNHPSDCDETDAKVTDQNRFY
ncbi:uncharacterized protein LOC128219958 [Mya arenaria]|uniref:uncharacterized protein LOC128219958 n=1 Tax=Mya arenaria TaxID=6604 RepID=UPI0022E51D1A|nr:uncharacterized protein LOC128219958 [Mya arenaria]